MALTPTSIARPIATSMIYLIIVVLGVIGFRFLPVDLLPPIEMTELNVEVRYPNVGPEEMELLITEPLENALAVVANVDRITSSSQEGQSWVGLRFEQGVDLAEAANDVREVLDRVRNSFPEEADPPRINKFNPDNIPVVMVGVQSEMDLTELTTVLERDVRKRFEQIPGIGSIEVWGGMEKEIHIEVMRDRLLASGLTMDDIVASVRTESSTTPGGNMQRGINDIYVRSLGEYQNLDEIRNTVIRMVNGVPLRVKDVADVRYSRADINRYIEVDGIPILRLGLRKQTGANTVAVVDGVRQVVEQLSQERDDMSFILMGDQSVFIQQSIDNVSSSAIWGGILAVIIMMAFLRNGSATAVISIAIPISIIATFSLLYLGGLSLNQMSFGGLALGVGLVVDNAIVVIENIVRLRQGGKELKSSALIGARQVTGAVIASTITTCVIFLPVIFMQTVTGSMFQELAIVVVFSLVCSLLVALTLVPMLASRFLTIKPDTEKKQKHGTGFLEAVELRYSRVVAWSLDHQSLVIGGTAVMMVLALFFGKDLSYELAPATESDEIDIDLRMDPGVNITVLHNYLGELDRMIREIVPWDEVEHYAKEVRNGNGSVELTLVGQDQRSVNAMDLADELRERLEGTIPGAEIRVRSQSGLWILNRIFGSGGEDAVQVELRGYNLDTAERLSLEIRRAMENVPGIVGVNVGDQEGRPEQSIVFDRARMAELGIGINQISAAIQSSISGTNASVFREGGDEIDIVVRLRPEDRLNVQDIENISVRASTTGEAIPISSLIVSDFDRGPTTIERIQGQRVVYIYANLERGVALGDAVEGIRAAIKDIAIPSDFTVVMGGEYEEQIKAQRDFSMAIVMALVLIYMVMAAQFERFLDPLIVMFSIPLALIGVVPTLILTNTTINMQSLMGLVMLIGMVVNNAIVLVDYINLLRREEGMSIRAAVVEAGRLRLRPIMMTTITTILGLLPLALGIGAGAEMQAALARVVIGGMMASTLVTLVFIPVVYLYSNLLRERLIILLSPLVAKISGKRKVEEAQHSHTA